MFTALFIPDGTPAQHACWTKLERLSAHPEAAACILDALHRIDVTAEAAACRTQALLALAALSWAGDFVAGRALGGAIDPVALNALRCGIAFALAGPWVPPLLWRNRGTVRRG